MGKAEWGVGNEVVLNRRVAFLWRVRLGRQNVDFS